MPSLPQNAACPSAQAQMTTEVAPASSPMRTSTLEPPDVSTMPASGAARDPPELTGLLPPIALRLEFPALPMLPPLCAPPVSSSAATSTWLAEQAAARVTISNAVFRIEPSPHSIEADAELETPTRAESSALQRLALAAHFVRSGMQGHSQVGSRSEPSWPEWPLEASSGERVDTLEVLRGGEAREIPVTIAERPRS